jgi:hypothetical protein
VCADVYLLASLPALAYLRKRERKWAFRAGLAIWLACTTWTGLSSASWLQHKLETAQAPVEQQKQAQERTEDDRQADLGRERALLEKQEDIALRGKNKEIRDNADRQATETRERIKNLEKLNTFPAKTEKAPIKSPFSGYEKLVTFLLLAFSQVCWFMALDEEPEEVAAEIGTARKLEMTAGNDALLLHGNGRNKPEMAAGNRSLEIRKARRSSSFGNGQQGRKFSFSWIGTWLTGKGISGKEQRRISAIRIGRSGTF